jgi:AcrR family transcriptional regulator
MRSAGEATRDRILVAAKKEFAERGPAGARINRIAAEAKASKERLYAYFPSKESLFTAVIEQLVTDVADDTVLSGGDLPGYVGRLFDNYVRNPENARLHDWLGFAPSDASTGGAEVAALRANLDEIRRGQDAGFIDARWDAAHLLIMLIELTKSMACPKDAARKLLETNRRNNSRAARRAAAISAAQSLIAPTDLPAPATRKPGSSPARTRARARTKAKRG